MMIELDTVVTALVLTAFTLLLVKSIRSKGARAAIALLVLVVSVLPYPWGLASWVLGYLSSLSITTGLLALAIIINQFIALPALPAKPLRISACLLVLFAIFFYPTSLGFTPLDPFSWGYGNKGLSFALLALGLLAVMLRQFVIACVLLVAQLAWLAGIMQSDNLFDYLFDPMLVIIAFTYLIKCGSNKNYPTKTKA